jgi:hypothetical protein
MDTSMAIGCVTMLLSNLEGCRPYRHPCRVSLWAMLRFFWFDFQSQKSYLQVRPGSVSVRLYWSRGHLAGERSSMSITLLGNQ